MSTTTHRETPSSIALAFAVSIHRECLRLQAYMAIRNKEEAMSIFEKVKKVDILMNGRSQNTEYSSVQPHAAT